MSELKKGVLQALHIVSLNHGSAPIPRQLEEHLHDVQKGWDNMMSRDESCINFVSLRENCTPKQNWSCFVHNLKIIITLWK